MLLALTAVGYLLSGGIRRFQRREPAFGSAIGAVIALLLAIWLASGLDGKTLPQVEAFLPPRVPVPVTPGVASNSEWILNDYDAALSAARTSGKLVFVDFTGYTCTNCRWMEANIFNRPDVGAQLGQFVLARL
jgi:thiol:disulfide interchange protein DsbD